MITEEFACFKKDLTSMLRNEVDQDVYETIVEAYCERLSLDKGNALKNPMVVEEIITEAKKQGKSSETLNEIITRIVALKDRKASEEE